MLLPLGRSTILPFHTSAAVAFSALLLSQVLLSGVVGHGVLESFLRQVRNLDWFGLRFFLHVRVFRCTWLCCISRFSFISTLHQAR